MMLLVMMSLLMMLLLLPFLLMLLLSLLLLHLFPISCVFVVVVDDFVAAPAGAFVAFVAFVIVDARGVGAACFDADAFEFC